jgi:hypothetical protein
VDSNEDGFRKSNVRAISSIGDGSSTKVGVQGYIGEKGIGFKSVFTVARKVHIQSNYYSFSFQHERETDDGLGMVTPWNEDHLELPENFRTRITLHLAGRCDRSELLEEFLALPTTLLLFLRQLRRLSVRVGLERHSLQWESTIISRTMNRIKLEIVQSSKAPKVLNFWTAKRDVTDMPCDPARKGISNAEIVLAFPLDEDDIPILEQQYVYAYLPLNKFGYKASDNSGIPTKASTNQCRDSS